MRPDEILDHNLAALLRSAGPAATPERTDEACALFLDRLKPRRRLLWLASAAALALFAVVLTVVVSGGGLRPARDPAEVDRWIVELGDERVEVREAAAARLEGLGLDAEYALAELERQKGRATRADRAAALERSIRERIGATLSHEARDSSPAEWFPELMQGAPKLEPGMRLEIYDVSDLADDPERLVDDLRKLASAQEWPDGQSVGLNGTLLAVTSTPKYQEQVRGFLAAARAARPSGPHVRPALVPLLDALSDDLLGLADDCTRARKGLGRAAQGADPEAQARARAVLDRLEAPLRRAASHHAHRRAVIERIRESWTRFGSQDALVAMIHEAFKPCEASDVRVLPLDDPSLPDRARGALAVGDGIVFFSGPIVLAPVADLARPGSTLLFTLPRDGRPARVASLRLTR